MAYCTATDVRLIIETSMETDDITSLIILADDEVDEMAEGVTLSDVDKKRCSMYLTAIMIAEKQPSSYTVGSVRINMKDRSARWLKKVQDIINDNRTIPVKVTSYQKIDQDSRYPL